MFQRGRETTEEDLRGLRFVVPMLGLIGLGMAALGFNYRPDIYMRFLAILMMLPAPLPFLDARQIPAVMQCLKQGIDVYQSLPCDIQHRVFAYSPLFLHATFLPSVWSNWLGLGLAIAFILSLALLPVPRRASDSGLLLLGMFSSMTAFAVERGNMDLAMFVLIASGGWLLARGFSLRLIGYALIALAGLLKFYPLVLFLLFLRERWSRCVALCGAAALLLIAFVRGFHAELAEMAKNLPAIPNFENGFASSELPHGLGIALAWLFHAAGNSSRLVAALPGNETFIVATYLVLIAATLAIVTLLIRRSGIRSAFAAIEPGERIFLLIGATVLGSCFFVSTNEDYRGIYFLFVIPGMNALLATATTRSLRVTIIATLGAILSIMWWLAIQHYAVVLSGGWLIPLGGSAVNYILWILHELAWWWTISVFLAVLLCFVLQSPMMDAIMTRWNRRVTARG